MSKERDLLNAMRDSLQDGGAEAAVAGAQNQEAADAAGTTLASAWDMTTQIASSMASDPIFYVKVLAVLILTVMIITISIELIAEGG